MKRLLNIILLISLFSGVSTVKAQFVVDLESGMIYSGYNDIRIPGDEGTLFSFNEDLISESDIFYRIRLDYTFNSNHTISILYAPLSVDSRGSHSEDISFQGNVFPANTELNGTYKFNSYRATYRYAFIKNSKFEFGLGFTAKIRDARIALESTESVSEKTNVGFVPIINFKLVWNFAEHFGLQLDGDALAAPQGRAEDVQLALRYNLSDDIALRAGYRILEGGADNDEVYNFALFHYALIGFSMTL